MGGKSLSNQNSVSIASLISIKKIILSFMLMCVASFLFAQINDKLYIEIAGEFIPTTGLGLIDKIERDEQNITLVIKVNQKTIRLVVKNSILNESFISYINTGDSIHLKEVDNEKKIAIFKRQNDSVKVKIFYAKR